MAGAALPLMIAGAAAGAATNKKDPLKGAILGGILGGAGGAVAPSLLGSAGASASAAGGSFIPAAALETQIAAAPASPFAGFLGKATTPAALIAGSQLAGAMQPQSQPAMSMPLRPGQQVPITMDQIRAVDQGAFDAPTIDDRMAMFYPNARFDEQGNLTGMNTGTFTPLRPVVSRRLSLL